MVKCIIAIAAICSSAIVPALGFVPQQASLSSRVPSIDYKSFDHSTKIFMAGGKVSNFFSKVTGRFRKEAEIPEVPSLAQTHMQGPLVNGAGAALTKEELEAVKAELEQIKKEFGLKEPERGFMDDEDIKWRFGGKPDYSVTNLLYLKQRSTVHKEGSLEMIVENLVKTWEMERSHKLDYTQHQSVDQKKFRISANGGKVFDNVEANQVGNYNVLMNACPVDLYDAQNTSWEESHDKFHTAFAAFPWEVLEVFSGPPKVAFTWRHWGTFTGEYDGNKGNGELVEMFGFGTAVVNDKLQLQDVEIYYNVEEFINVLRGNKKPEEVNANWKSNSGCPFSAMKNAMSLVN